MQNSIIGVLNFVYKVFIPEWPARPFMPPYPLILFLFYSFL